MHSRVGRRCDGNSDRAVHLVGGSRGCVGLARTSRCQKPVSPLKLRDRSADANVMLVSDELHAAVAGRTTTALDDRLIRAVGSLHPAAAGLLALTVYATWGLA